MASAILEVHLTEAGRTSINHATNILGDKGIINGPSNLLSVGYRPMPVAITVEGANSYGLQRPSHSICGLH